MSRFEEEEFKQAILIRNDLKMGKGKIAAQASHASVEAVLKSENSIVSAWRDEGMKKIVLKVNSKEELFKYQEKAKKAKLITAAICDAGHTQLEPGTYTALAIGPDSSEKIDKIVSELSLL